MLGSLACGTSAGFTSWAAKTTFDSGYKVPRISWARFAGGAWAVGDCASIREVDMALTTTSASTALVMGVFLLVPDLGADILNLVDLAVAALSQKPRVWERANR